MKRQTSSPKAATVSSLTGRRVDSTLASRRAVKNALSSVRGWCGKLRREVGRWDEKIRDQRRSRRDDVAARRLLPGMQLDDEELRNLNNENLENELRELAEKSNL